MNKSDLSGVKKGDKLVLMGFTGIRLADVKVAAADKKFITVEKSDGSEMIFSRKDGVQTNVEEGKEKYANRILLPEDAPEQKDRTVRKAKDDRKDSKKDKKEDKKASKKSEPEDAENDEDEDEDEEAPAPKKGKKEDKKEDKKAGKKDDKKSSKKSKKDEDEDDDDEYEEV